MPASYFCQSCAFALKNNFVLSVPEIGRPNILLTWNMQWHDLSLKILSNTYSSTMTYFCPAILINLGCFLIKTQRVVIGPIQWLFSLSQVQYSTAWTLELWIQFPLQTLQYVCIFSVLPYVGRGFAMGRYFSRGSYQTTTYKVHKSKNLYALGCIGL